ncbi:MAG: fibronectin type III domain-containing protein [Bacteroidota bacterium]
MNQKKNITKLKLLFAVLLTAAAITGCVENLTDTTQNATPTIEIYSPATNDSVQIGENTISYIAADGTGGSGLSFYEVYLNDAFIQRFEQNSDGTNPELNLNVDSTLIGSRISYFVKVYNENGRSKESTKQTNIYVKDKPPAAPSDLFLTRINDFSVNMLWSDNSGNELGFELWRRDGGSGTYRKIKTLPPNTISTDDNGLSPFVDYFYKVRAYNSSGYSDFCDEASTSSIPGGPWNLEAEAIGASVVRLKWTDFAVNESGFIIERTNTFTNNFERIAIVNRNTTEYEDNTVQGSTGYRYRLAYYTTTSISGYSNEVSISTFYIDVNGPTNLTAEYYAPNNVVILNWEDNTDLEKGVIIERKVDSGEFVEYGKFDQDDITAANDAGVESGKTYYYRVRQILGTKTYTPYSNTVNITIP